MSLKNKLKTALTHVDIKDNTSEYYYDTSLIKFNELNDIRRALFRDIPTIAISSLLVTNNTTYLQEEEILQALALVVIRHTLCKHGVDPKVCKTKMSLNITGPHLVMSTDLKLLTPNKHFNIIGGEYPLFNIDVGTLTLVATATIGTGQDHAAYFPVNVVYANIIEDTYKLTIEGTGAREVSSIYDEVLEIL